LRSCVPATGHLSPHDELLFATLPAATLHEYEAASSQGYAPHVWPAIASGLDPEPREHLLQWAKTVTTVAADLARALVAFVPFLDGPSREETLELLIGPRLIRHLGDALAHEYLFLESNGLDFWIRFGALMKEFRPEHWDAIEGDANSSMRDLALYLLCVTLRGADRMAQYRLIESLLAPRPEISAEELLAGIIALTALIEVVGGQAALESCRLAIKNALSVLA
jgi:hypothetical protein